MELQQPLHAGEQLPILTAGFFQKRQLLAGRWQDAGGVKKGFFGVDEHGSDPCNPRMCENSGRGFSTNNSAICAQNS
jgi:hypothetical protein